MKITTEVFRFLLLTFLAVSCQKKDDDESRAYEFGFRIAGEQHRHEKKDVNGIIQGEFGFITADGIYHVTVYATDENGNFHILSMKNIRISAPLDGSPLPPGAKISGQPGNQGTPGNQSPVQPITQLASTTRSPQRPYQFTTQPTIKPACGGCGYVTTPKPRPGEKFPFQNPVFRDPASNAIPSGDVGSNPSFPGNQPNDPYNNQVNQNYPGSNPLNPAYPNNQAQANYPGSPVQPNYPQGPVQTNYPGSPVQSNYPGNSLQPNYPGNSVQPNYPAQGNPYYPGGEPNPPQNSINPLSSNPQSPGYTQPLSGIVNPDGTPYFPNANPNRNEPGPLPPSKVTVDNNVIHVPGNPDIPIRDKYPGMVDGLPNGIEQKDISDLLYKFNYTVGFHGHYETGYKNGAKVGGYFVNGRDGISRIVTYVADENGYRPKVKFVRIGLDSDDTPKEGTEKKFGLKNFEFVWYPVK